MPNNNLLYGIIGGMGPATSSEFVSYVYSQCEGKFASERDYPRIILISDSLAPDRLHSYKNDNFSTLKNYLEKTIMKLNGFEVDKIIICCIVAHACLKDMPHSMRENVISMIDLLNLELNKLKKSPLLLSTSILYDMKLIDHDNVIHLNKYDLEKMNYFIYKLKVTTKQEDYINCISYIQEMLNYYQSDSVLFACSDLHLVNRYIMKNNLSVSFQIIDLMDLAATYILNFKHI
jgi:aspartate racemase